MSDGWQSCRQEHRGTLQGKAPNMNNRALNDWLSLSAQADDMGPVLPHKHGGARQARIRSRRKRL